MRLLSRNNLVTDLVCRVALGAKVSNTSVGHLAHVVRGRLISKKSFSTNLLGLAITCEFSLERSNRRAKLALSAAKLSSLFSSSAYSFSHWLCTVMTGSGSSIVIFSCNFIEQNH